MEIFSNVSLLYPKCWLLTIFFCFFFDAHNWRCNYDSDNDFVDDNEDVYTITGEVLTADIPSLTDLRCECDCCRLWLQCITIALSDILRGYRGGSPTAVQAWRLCRLWEPSPVIVDWGICCVLCLYLCLLYFSVNCVLYSMCSFSTLILLVGFFGPVKTVARITYTVLVETLSHAQSIVIYWYTVVY